MFESTSERGTVEPSEAASVKQEWHTPTLTTLGDARDVTEAAGTKAPDGIGTSIIS